MKRYHFLNKPYNCIFLTFEILTDNLKQKYWQKYCYILQLYFLNTFSHWDYRFQLIEVNRVSRSFSCVLYIFIFSVCIERLYNLLHKITPNIIFYANLCTKVIITVIKRLLMYYRICLCWKSTLELVRLFHSHICMRKKMIIIWNEARISMRKLNIFQTIENLKFASSS